MVLSDSLFEWFYDEAFPQHVQLNNISGGTDLAGCFGVGNPLSPVFVGGCSGFSLGIPVAVYDDTVEGGTGVKGVPVSNGIPGELVATAAFPNMPVTFWGDNGPQRYFEAYFNRFDSECQISSTSKKGLIWLYRRVDSRRHHNDPPIHTSRPILRTSGRSAQPLRHPVWIC